MARLTHTALTHSIRSTRSTARTLVLLLAAAVLSVSLGAPAARAAPPRKDSREAQQEMMKWFARIDFFSEEESGAWSLRINDRNATERATIKHTELWKYDVDAKKWVKIGDGAPAAKIVLAEEKPANSPPDTQVIGDMPIEPNSVGLFYAKWVVNGTVEGATMSRIGPNVVGKAAREAAANPPKVPEGHIVQAVPISLNEAKMLVIPDPRKFTGQPTDKPTSRPSK